MMPFAALLLERAQRQWLIRDSNRAFTRLTGLETRDFLHRNLSDLSSEDLSGKKSYWKEVARDLEEDTEGETPAAGRLFETLSEAGEVRYWKIESQRIAGETESRTDWAIHTAVECTREVLEAKGKPGMNPELEKTVAERRAFIESNPDGLYSLDLEGNFISANQGLEKILEQSSSEIIQRNFRMFCPEYDIERVQREVDKVLSGSSVQFEVDLLLPEDRKKVLSIWLMPMVKEEKIRGAHGIAKDITELKKVSMAIREKEEEVQKNNLRFKTLVEGASDFFGIVDASGVYQYVSDSTKAILGFETETFVGENAFDYIHPEDRDRVYAEFSRITAVKRVKIPAFRFPDAKGNWRWMETTVTNMMENPEIEGLVINTRDVTEVVLKDQEINELFDRYALAATATGDLIYDWDLPSDSFKRFFKGKERQFGYAQEEMEKRSFWKDNIHPEEIRGLTSTLKSALSDPNRSEIRSEYRFKRKDGTYAHLIDRGMILRNPAGEAKRLIGAISDISDIVYNRQALSLANARFSYALKATQEMIWDWDIQEQMIQRGRSFEKLLGFDPGTRPYHEDFWFRKIAYKDQERVRRSLKEALEDPAVDHWKQEYRFFKNTGEKAFVIDRAYILRDAAGAAIRMVGAALDVTESRQMLKAIKKQNKILKEVAWEQAHVVRAPLARMKGILNLLEEERGNTDPEWNEQELLGWVLESADELDEVIRKIIQKTEGT